MPLRVRSSGGPVALVRSRPERALRILHVGNFGFKTVKVFLHGVRAEGCRLARDLKVKVVGPLDGIPTSSLQGGQLAVVVGA